MVRKAVFDFWGAKMTDKCLKIAFLGLFLAFGVRKCRYFTAFWRLSEKKRGQSYEMMFMD